MDIKNKRVTVIGLGNSGLNAALLAREKGAEVFVTDSANTPELKKAKLELESKGIEVEIGEHTECFVKGSDLVVVSPGVENSSAAVKWALKEKIPIISEMELGYAFCRGRIIAITGTNGKSTVTTLIGEILRAGDKRVVVCGNIGNSLCGEVSKIKDDTWVVLEVSSAQLERIERFRPHIAVILNITDDHRDRYRTFYEYFNYKLRIFSNQQADDILVLNYDAENLRRLKGLTRSRVVFYGKQKVAGNTYNISAYVKDEWVCCRLNGKEREIVPVVAIKLKGVHNLENVLACSLVGALVGVEDGPMREAIKNFKGLEHRFETVDTINGVEYINDSKGTTVDSAKRALESCEKPVILIAGGKDKHSDYSVARDVIKKKAAHVVLMGEAAPMIKKALKNTVEIHEADDMYDAVETAHKLAKEGWIVLLSPMCSSFDMFKNYEERGRVFKDAVKRLKNSLHGVKT
ncbi:MAG: UDP-N-acetylmuramoyl-L-alanine--D-glutamate ligase [Candidatus Omnitrophica bacterium]|nr:UDP-N-acetylmuramoyl-L-alanine--D-glutamate ligase [Candidatus Omnitrophota bacterium]MCM8790702.1 UDP-N-acetylmuramoyl-L-alanine--D-glutamate ligase [Candidatus Omnitrophota bacterium]